MRRDRRRTALSSGKRTNTKSHAENRENRAGLKPNFQRSFTLNELDAPHLPSVARIPRLGDFRFIIRARISLSAQSPGTQGHSLVSMTYDSPLGARGDVHACFSLRAGCAINMRSKDAQYAATKCG